MNYAATTAFTVIVLVFLAIVVVVLALAGHPHHAAEVAKTITTSK
jgi:hypothetical protein